MATKHYMFSCGFSGLSSTGTCYAGIGITSWLSTIEGRATGTWPVSGTISKLRFFLSAAPTSGKSWTATLRVNGSSSALTCTIADDNTVAVDTSHSVSISAGDSIAWLFTSSGSPSVSGVTPRISMEFVATNDNEIPLMLANYTASAVSQINEVFNGIIFGGHQSPWAASIEVQDIVPIDGAITKTYWLANSSPGTGRSYTVVIYKNNVKQDGSGGTVDTRLTITGSATSGNASFNLPVSAGDRIFTSITPSGTPSAVRPGVSFVFAPTTDGESFIASFGPAINNSGSVFVSFWGELQISATEADVQWPTPSYAIQLDNFRVCVGAAPGTGKSRVFTVRKDTDDTPITCTLGATDVSASDLSHSATYTSSNTLDIYHVATVNSTSVGSIYMCARVTEYTAPSAPTFPALNVAL